MKAVEWAAKFQAAASEEEVLLVLGEFGIETAELITVRTKGSNNQSRLAAADGAVREQKQKFGAIKSRVPTLTDEQFDMAVDKTCLEYRQWQAEVKKRVEQKKQEEQGNDGPMPGRTFGNRNFNGKPQQPFQKDNRKPGGGQHNRNNNAPRRPAPRGR